jgi:hypothetical protein
MTTFDNHIPTVAAPPPSPEEGRNWTLALHGLWQTVAFPERFFAARLHAAWVIVPLAVVALVKIALIRAQLPYLLQAILRSMPEAVAARYLDNPGALLAGRLWPQYIGGLVTPILTVSVVATLLYLVSLSLGHLCRFTNMFVAAAYGWLIYTLKTVFTFVLLTLRGVDSVSGPESLQPPVGLGLLFRDGGAVFRTFVDTFNVFDLWFVFVVAVAVHKSEKLSPKTAAMIAAGSWLIFQGFRIGLVYLSQQVVG